MKTSRLTYAEHLRAVVQWMDRWEERGFASFPEFVEHLDSICVCRAKRRSGDADCQPGRCQAEYDRAMETTRLEALD